MNEFIWEPISLHHAEELVDLWSDRDVIRYTAIPEPCSLEKIRSRIRVLSAFDVFALRMEGEVIGVVGCIRMNESKDQYGLFYQIKKSYWGKGLATCAVEQILKRMKEKSPSAVFYADVVVDNIASEKILKHFHFHCISVEKNGFVRDGVKRTVRNYKL